VQYLMQLLLLLLTLWQCLLMCAAAGWAAQLGLGPGLRGQGLLPLAATAAAAAAGAGWLSAWSG
jgi:hypothetical protein